MYETQPSITTSRPTPHARREGWSRFLSFCQLSFARLGFGLFTGRRPSWPRWEHPLPRLSMRMGPLDSQGLSGYFTDTRTRRI
jgi:hypothetical protein